MNSTKVMAASSPPKGKRKNWFRYFQFDNARDTPTETRSVLLIIFTLIATVTFQAGVNPPGGVWQDNGNGHLAGRAIYASQNQAYYVFLIFNTLAFFNSILVILSLTQKFPFNFEVWIATVSMAVTYGSAIFAISPGESVDLRFVLIAAAGPFTIRLLKHGFNIHWTKAHQEDSV